MFVEDLGSGERGGADEPRRLVPTAQQHQPAAELQHALNLDHASDVRRVARATAGDHVLPDLVELPTELLDLLGGLPGVAGTPIVRLSNSGTFSALRCDSVEHGSHTIGR